MMSRLFSLVILSTVVFWLLFSSIFLVDQRQYAVLLTFGEIKNIIKRPGLHLKLPFPIQSTTFLDNRILNADSINLDHFITLENKDILVNVSVKWQINDPNLYLVRSSGNKEITQNKILELAKASLRREISNRTVKEIVSGKRGVISDLVIVRLKEKLKNIGINIVDLHLSQVNYVEQEANSSFYECIKSDRSNITNELRAVGHKDLERIRANADKKCVLILAEAHRDAKKIRGEGDAAASEVYAKTFRHNLEFYKFYRSMEVYRATFKNHRDLIIIDPNSDFFKYSGSLKSR